MNSLFMSQIRVRVVGAGFSGAVAARVLADHGARIELWDKRDHIGGNAFDTPDAQGVWMHPYGPHIFHTQSQKVFDWLSRFTQWRSYEHRVKASVDGQLVPMPINRSTINQLYGLALDSQGVEDFLASVREPVAHPQNSEQAVWACVGKDLCDRLYRGYTRKQWGRDLSELSASVVTRIPVRTHDDDRYFTDTFQCMPQDGYTALFGRMLDHPHISIRLNQAFDPANPAHHEGCDALIYCGPVDAYFQYIYGPLPYRSIRFEHIHHKKQDIHQPVAVVNFPNEHAYTRVTEWKHITGQRCAGTTLTREYPSDEGEPFYPVPSDSSQRKFERYKALCETQDKVVFIGRLAEYRYYNMDQAVASSLAKSTALAMKLGLMVEVV
jgi:UDP-galactopyranose mutase